MSKLNPEIKYPIFPNVLIDYIKNTSVYPIYIGSDFTSFSTEPYMGKGSKLPSENKTAKIENDKLLYEKSVEELLNKLDLSISDFEEYLKSNL
mgnify:CR=1 FL=1